MQAPDFLGEDTSAEASKLVPGLDLGESANEIVEAEKAMLATEREFDKEVQRRREVMQTKGEEEARKLNRDIDKARDAMNAAQDRYFEAIQRQPTTRSVGRLGPTEPTKSVLGFTAGRRTRRNLRKRNRKTRKWTSSATRKRR